MNTTDNKQSNSATNQLTVDFSHRLSATQTASSGSVVESIGLMTDRALGVLHLLSIQFEGSCDSRLSDALMCGVIDSAIQEVEDIKSVIIAFAEPAGVKKKVQS